MQLAEALTESDVLFRRQDLVAEEYDEMIKQGVLDFAEGFRVQRLRQIDA